MQGGRNNSHLLVEPACGARTYLGHQPTLKNVEKRKLNPLIGKQYLSDKRAPIVAISRLPTNIWAAVVFAVVRICF